MDSGENVDCNIDIISPEYIKTSFLLSSLTLLLACLSFWV